MAERTRQFVNYVVRTYAPFPVPCVNRPNRSHICKTSNTNEVQLLRFIVSGDSVNIMHKDIKPGNVFVVNTHDTESATLAVGDFGAAQRGVPTVRLGG